jgi:hypothetical protein
MMPDADGNTLLHLMALGKLKEKEFDFIKFAVLKYNLRLTRNKDNRTPLNIIKTFGAQAFGLKGQPKYKRKVWEWFEMHLE